MCDKLWGTNAEIVYLDMSTSSMKVAKERAAMRKLDNITWVHDSILNIPNLDLGEFDFITCTGVLHHLEDPQAGLDALKSVLHKDGAMYLMVYATYGRTGVYQMQDMLKRVNSGVFSIEDKIENSKKILKRLPQSNWFSFNKSVFGLDLDSDIGIYDLLLHTQDRSYTVPEMYDYVEKSDLRITKLFNPDHPLGDMLFQPETYINDPELLTTLKAYPFREQAAICELLVGQLMKQCCFIAFKERATPSCDDLDMIPSVSVATSLKALEQLTQVFQSNQPSIQLNNMITISRTQHLSAIWNALDGERSIRQIAEVVVKGAGKTVTVEKIIQDFKSLYTAMNSIGAMYLRAANVPRYSSLPELEKRMYEYYGEAECKKVWNDLFSQQANKQKAN